MKKIAMMLLATAVAIPMMFADDAPKTDPAAPATGKSKKHKKHKKAPASLATTTSASAK
jgi:hypothetical protein